MNGKKHSLLRTAAKAMIDAQQYLAEREHYHIREGWMESYWSATVSELELAEDDRDEHKQEYLQTLLAHI